MVKKWQVCAMIFAAGAAVLAANYHRWSGSNRIVSLFGFALIVVAVIWATKRVISWAVRPLTPAQDRRERRNFWGIVLLAAGGLYLFEAAHSHGDRWLALIVAGILLIGAGLVPLLEEYLPRAEPGRGRNR